MSALNDPDRLRALERSGLLRKTDMERLVHVCYTVTELLDVDVSQINIITADKHVFVAEWPRVPPREPLDLVDSGCTEVVLADAPVSVPDAFEHPLMCRMPWVANWRGYLGVPLHFDGQVVGSLCALTVTPREWTDRDRLAMWGLAALAESCIAGLTTSTQGLPPLPPEG